MLLSFCFKLITATLLLREIAGFSCTPNPCYNGGTCSVVDGIPKCNCTSMHTGPLCTSPVFVGSSGTSGCAYHISSLKQRTHADAKRICERNYTSTLAIVRSNEQQEEIGNLARNVYGNDLSLWIGGRKRNSGNWFWYDNVSIPTTSISGYPRWGNKKPSSTYGKIYLLLSTDEALSGGRGAKQRSLYWTKEDDSFRAGYVCEKLVGGSPCDSSPCQHGGTCEHAGGCSYTCQCRRRYQGYNCERLPLKFRRQPAVKNIVNDTFSLICEAVGIPRPNITWRITNYKLFPGMSHIISGGSGSPFTVENTVSGYTTQSKLTMNAGGLCLHESYIGCKVRNAVEQISSRSININRVLYFSLNQSYFVFPANERKEADTARDSCLSISGELASFPDRYTQDVLTSKIDSKNFKTSKDSKTSKDFWIGLRRNTNGVWEWSNQQKPSYNNWALGDAKKQPCAYLSFHNNKWVWKSGNCSSTTAHYVCEVPNNNLPRIVSVKSPPCVSGKETQLTVRWLPSPSMVGVFHRVNASSIEVGRRKDVILNSLPLENGLRVVALDNLKPDTTYNISISVSPDYCSMPIVTSMMAKTGHAAFATNISKAYMKLGENNLCEVTWSLPRNENSASRKFKVKLMKLPNVVTRGLNEKVSNFIEKEDSVLSVSQNLSVSFIALPNRRHVIEISAQSCAGNGQAVRVKGQCVAPSAAPPTVPSPTLIGQSNEISITIKPADERNGPISCYFVIGQYYAKTRDYHPTNSTETFLDEISTGNHTVITEGQQYIALALNGILLANDVTVPLGDMKKTSCDIYDESNFVTSSRDKRSVTKRKFYNATNHPILADKHYIFYVISSTPIGNDDVSFKASEATSDIKAEKNSKSSMWLIIGIPGGVLVLLVVVAVAFLKRRQVCFNVTSNSAELNDKSSHKTKKPEPTQRQSAILLKAEHQYVNVIELKDLSRSSTAIPLNNFLEIYKSLIDENNTTLQKQFKDIVANSSQLQLTTEVGNMAKNKKRNRYKNIIPYDNTRVKLEIHSGNTQQNDYINAGYIDSFDQPQFFIATQGPLDRTIEHFWTMIWQKKCRVIVMLANLVENERDKCAKYWPDPNAKIETDRLVVFAEETEVCGHFVIRKFKVSQKDCEDVKELTVTQLHYMDWPDHGVPATSTTLLRLHSACLRINTENSPIVVHCSAGVGRTGTLIAIDYLMREMKCSSWIDVSSAVMNMRRQRRDMVQTQKQYEFIYKTMAEIFLFGDTDISIGDFDEFIKNHDSNYFQEFNNLDAIPPLNTSRVIADQPISSEKIRNNSRAPYDRARVVLNRSDSEDVPPYINACYVKGYPSCGTMIATQGPMSNTVNEFWRTVLDCGVKIIVMLTPLQEGNEEMSVCYWPVLPGSSLSFGDVTVESIDEKSEVRFTVRRFDVVRKDIKVRVTHIHYENWRVNDMHPDVEELVGVLNDVALLRSQTEEGSLLVHCSDGLGRTGVFCALSNMVERLKAEQKIDVFRTVKDLRDIRPGMIPSLEMYRLCYRLMKVYVSSFNPNSIFST